MNENLNWWLLVSPVTFGRWKWERPRIKRALIWMWLESEMAHRAKTTWHWQTRFWETPFCWARFHPASFALLLTDYLQVCFGPLAPVQCLLNLVMLSAGLHKLCPIQPYFRIFTSWLIRFWWDFSLVGDLLTPLDVQDMLLMKIWSLVVVVVVVLVTLHVSAPYRRTSFMLVLILILFCVSCFADAVLEVICATIFEYPTLFLRSTMHLL